MNGIIKADERAAQPHHVNIALFGTSGVGKTTQATTLPAKSTLFVDLEAGSLALGKWKGDVFDVRSFATKIGAHPWEMTRALALYLGGSDPADAAGNYSQPIYDQICGVLGDPSELERYDTIFIDSITVASRWAFLWSKLQPEAVSEKTGKPDTRSAYGLLGQELVRWLTHLQHAPKSIIVSGILDRFEDDLKRVSYTPQIEGGKAPREISGIFDLIVTMDYLYDQRGTALLDANGKKIRALYPTSGNTHGFPGKDRSGTLDMIEPPNIAAMISKAQSGNRIDTTVVTLETPAEPSALVA